MTPAPESPEPARPSPRPSTGAPTGAAATAATRGTAASAVRRALADAERWQPVTAAFTDLDADGATAAAAALDALPDAERAALPLAGVPLAVKADGADDSLPVRRLVDAGCVPIGHTATPELCVWGMTDSGPGGITRNPWDPGRTPGGSSGGSAAAVAAGVVPLATGGDGMGSLRIPAACCGLVTLKAGTGVVPTELPPDNWGGLAESGVLARTTAEVALATSVMAGRPDLARIGGTHALHVGVATTSTLRIGSTPLGAIDPRWQGAAESAGDALALTDVEVSRVDAPAPDDPLLLLALWAKAVERDAAAKDLPLSALERRTRHHALLGRTAFRGDTHWERSRGRFRASAERFFDSHRLDVLITPALARFPPEAARWGERSWARNIAASVRFAPFVSQWNVLGWPAMSVPTGLAELPGGTRLPVGVQLVGPPGSESTLLAMAAEIERRTPRPGIAPG